MSASAVTVLFPKNVELTDVILFMAASYWGIGGGGGGCCVQLEMADSWENLLATTGLKMELVGSSETLVDKYRLHSVTWRMTVGAVRTANVSYPKV
jgi:hypothetical protein